jgi:hypothetical protein
MACGLQAPLGMNAKTCRILRDSHMGPAHIGCLPDLLVRRLGSSARVPHPGSLERLARGRSPPGTSWGSIRRVAVHYDPLHIPDDEFIDFPVGSRQGGHSTLQNSPSAANSVVPPGLSTTSHFLWTE